MNARDVNCRRGFLPLAERYDQGILDRSQSNAPCGGENGESPAGCWEEWNWLGKIPPCVDSGSVCFLCTDEMHAMFRSALAESTWFAAELRCLPAVTESQPCCLRHVSLAAQERVSRLNRYPLFEQCEFISKYAG